MSLDNRIWVGLLTVLNAVLFGIIFTIDRREPPQIAPPPAPALVPATPPPLSPTPIPSWPAEMDTPVARSAASTTSETVVTADDVRAPASLELSAGFAESVQRAQAAGVDEVLLAHAVVARFHRQTEAMMYGEDRVQLDDATREQARADTVIKLLGESAYQGWQRSDYMMSHNLAGTDVTAEELDLLMQINQERERKIQESWKSANRIRRPNLSNLNAEYRQQLLNAFGQERVRQLGLY